MCGGKDRFRFDNKEGAGTWFCSHCGSGDGFHLLQVSHGWSFAEAARHVESVAGKYQAGEVKPVREVDEIRKSLNRVWRESKPIQEGDPVHRYLSNRCGEIPMCLYEIRYHANLSYRHEDDHITHHPALVARVVNGTPKHAVCIHRIYLTDDGCKADVPEPKKLMSPTQKLENVAVRLMAPLEGWLGVAEGLETAIAAWRRFQVPVWACLTAGLMKTFRPPPEVKLLTVFADNDDNFTGQAAAYELARSCSMGQGIEVQVKIPDRAGSDWAD
jgi:putative DNA primase/helicase